MLKNILSVAATALAVSAMLAVSANTAFAESTKKLTDDADILLDSQEEIIENNLKKCTLATGWDTIIYTNNNNVSSYDIEDYCNDYFDNHDYGCGDEKSGVFLTVDMSSREMYIITKGEAMYYFDDSRMDTMLDDVQAELADGNYQGACNEFIDSVQYYHSVGKSTGNSTYNNVKIQDEPLTLADRFLKGMYTGAVLALAVGAFAAGACVIIRYKYSQNGKGANYDLEKNSSLNLTESRDQFLYKNVTYTTVSSSSSSSSSHRSHRSSSSHHSSHSSHGGGGRHF